MRRALLHPSLRAFVALAEHGTLALAGHATHRSPSAVSLQIAALEERLGRVLFTRGARGMALTPAGQLLMRHACALLDVEQAAVDALASLEPSGAVRWGMPQDVATAWLAPTLAAFRQTHAAVSVTAVIERCSTLSSMVARQQVDLAVLVGRAAMPHALCATRQPTSWHAAEGFRWSPSAPLPLVVADPPCLYREDALRALARAGLRHEVVFASGSIAGLWAAVQAGVGVAARAGFGAPAGVRDVTAQLEGARLPDTTLSLVRTGAAPGDAVDALAGLVAAQLLA